MTWTSTVVCNVAHLVHVLVVSYPLLHTFTGHVLFEDCLRYTNAKIDCNSSASTMRSYLVCTDLLGLSGQLMSKQIPSWMYTVHFAHS